VFVHSTDAMDYVWALAFILAALYFVVVRRPLAAGIALGLAIACRITSGAMLVPFGLLWVRREPGPARLRALLVSAAAACLVGAAWFAPAFARYGWSVLAFHESGYPPAATIARRMTEEVWGRVGVAAIAAAAMTIPFRRSQAPAAERDGSIAAWWAAIALYGIAFLRLPHQAGYLVPVVPFVLLLLHALCARWVFLAVCAALAVSSLISFGRSGPARGPVLQDHAARLADLAGLERIAAAADRLPAGCVVVTGHWHPKLELYRGLRARGGAQFVWLLGADDARRAACVYYLPDQNDYNIEELGADLVELGARPLLIR
jgi:hypothetical protein